MAVLRKNLKWREAVNRAIDVVLPPRCVVSGDIIDQPGVLSADIWSRLKFISAPYCDVCGVPFEFEIGEGSLCAKCQSHPPLYDRARAALVYDDVSRDIILKFKHGDQINAAPVFVPWLKQAGADILADTDVLVPVPLHYWRLLRRRYNQAALLGQFLAREIGISFLPEALQRTRATPPQGKLDQKSRQKNVKNAFVINPKAARVIYGKNIVLVDDVFTTGSTVSECAKVLKKAGAKSVSVLAAARVVRSEFMD